MVIFDVNRAFRDELLEVNWFIKGTCRCVNVQHKFLIKQAVHRSVEAAAWHETWFDLNCRFLVATGTVPMKELIRADGGDGRLGTSRAVGAGIERSAQSLHSH